LTQIGGVQRYKDELRQALARPEIRVPTKL